MNTLLRLRGLDLLARVVGENNAIFEAKSGEKQASRISDTSIVSSPQFARRGYNRLRKVFFKYFSVFR